MQHIPLKLPLESQLSQMRFLLERVFCVAGAMSWPMFVHGRYSTGKLELNSAAFSHARYQRTWLGSFLCACLDPLVLICKNLCYFQPWVYHKGHPGLLLGIRKGLYQLWCSFTCEPRENLNPSQKGKDFLSWCNPCWLLSMTRLLAPSLLVGQEGEPEEQK